MLLIASPAFAEGRFFKRIPKAEGLETETYTTYDVARSNDGFVWLATDHGLLRFDGEHCVSVPFPGHTGERVVVRTVTPTESGSLLIGTNATVYLLDTFGKEPTFKTLLGGRSFPATSSLYLPGKFSVIGGDEGLMLFDPATGEERHILVGSDVLDPSNKIKDIAVSDEDLLLLTAGGIYRLKSSSQKVVPVSASDKLLKLEATAIASADGKIYIGTTSKGVWRLDSATGRLDEAFDLTHGNVVTDLELSPDGRYMYIGTDGSGVIKVDLSDEKVVNISRHSKTDPVSPRCNQVYSLFADPGGHIWVGYYQNGADYTPSWNGPFHLVDNPDAYNTRGVPVRALAIKDGRITIGTREGIVVFERNCSTAWRLSTPQLRSDMVISLLEREGKTYIGTYGGGLQILDPVSGSLGDLPGAESFPVFKNGHIFSMAEDTEGNLWVGTSDGLYCFPRKGTPRSYNSSGSQIPDDNVYGIFFDSEGKGWICTHTGLCIYDPRQKRLRTDLFPKSFPNAVRYRMVYEDSSRRLYFIPESGMAFSSELNMSGIRKIESPLLDNADAKGIVEDMYHNMWLTTNRGLFRIDSSENVIRYGQAAGLPSPSFLQGQPLRDDMGNIWFGNSDGLVCLSESEIDQTVEESSPLVLSYIKVNGKLRDILLQKDTATDHYHINLGRSSDSVQLYFTTFSYAIEDPESYLYRLDDKEWQSFSGNLELSLYELSPGTHRLLVKSANATDADAPCTTVDISVPYPEWWYVVGGLILALLLTACVVWVLVLRRRNREPQTAELEQDVMRLPDADLSPVETTVVAPKQKYASNNLPVSEGKAIKRNVERIMKEEKPYLNPDLKLADLASLAGISSHKMSQFFSQCEGQSFYDYVNTYRVEEFKKIAKDEKNRNLTLSAMGELAGFSSRASFFRYFKNAEGVSPGEYLKSIERDH